MRQLLARFTAHMLETPAEPSGQASEPAAAPVPQPPAPAGDSPWAADLAGIIPDETLRGGVDSYLRTQWQPRVTQLEQQVAASQPAAQLYNDLTETPVETFVAIGTQLFGDEAGPYLQAMFEAEQAQEAQAAVVEAGGPPMDPRVQALLDREEQAQREAAYAQEIATIRAQDPELQDEIFHPFVIAADGDFAQAHQAYQAFVAQARQLYGGAPVEATPAPHVIGTESAGTTAPPLAPSFSSIDDALNDTMDEINGRKAVTPVGAA